MKKSNSATKTTERAKINLPYGAVNRLVELTGDSASYIRMQLCGSRPLTDKLSKAIKTYRKENGINQLQAA